VTVAYPCPPKWPQTLYSSQIRAGTAGFPFGHGRHGQLVTRGTHPPRGGQLPKFGYALAHVPAATASDTRAVLGGDHRAEPVVLQLDRPAGPRRDWPWTQEHRGGQHPSDASRDASRNIGLAVEEPPETVEPADMPASLLRLKGLCFDLLQRRLQRLPECRPVALGSAAPVDQRTHLITRKDHARSPRLRE
jgi:hypothetical protein